VIPNICYGFLSEFTLFWKICLAGALTFSAYFGYFIGTLFIETLEFYISRKLLLSVLTILQGICSLILIFAENIFLIITLRLFSGFFYCADILIKVFFSKQKMLKIGNYREI